MKLIKETIIHKWTGGKIIVSKYTQKFIENENVWYKYVVKRDNGTIVEECKTVSVTLEMINTRIAYYQSIAEKDAKKMMDCDKRFKDKKVYLAQSGDVKAWAVS